MRVSADAFGVLCSDKWSPSLSMVGRAENIWRHVSERVAIESSVGGACIEVTRLHPADPRILWQTGNVADNICPGFAGIARELQISVIGSNPDQIFVLWRFADRINRRVHFRRRIVDRHAARLLLLLLLR